MPQIDPPTDPQTEQATATTDAAPAEAGASVPEGDPVAQLVTDPDPMGVADYVPTPAEHARSCVHELAFACAEHRRQGVELPQHERDRLTLRALQAIAAAL